MIATVIILVVILLYAAWVIRKKVKDVKKGNFCGCGCGDCPSKSKCSSKEDKKN